MQAMSELIPVTVIIANRSYRLRILPEDEEVLRKTVKTINEKIIEFKTQFAGKDMQDYVAMVLVWFATQTSASQGSENGGPLASDQLSQIEKELDLALNGQP